MRKICLSVLMLMFAKLSFGETVTSERLKTLAECIAASQMVAADAQLKGNFNAQKNWEKLASVLMDKFYSELSIYSQGNTQLGIEVGRWPNIEVARYSAMNDRAQARYVQQVLETNRCMDLAK